MKNSVLQVLMFVSITVVATLPEARAQGSSDRFFSMLDRNRDGVLEGDEMSRLPGSMREALGGRSRITPQDFASAIAQMRSSRGSSGGFSREGSSGGFGQRGSSRSSGFGQGGFSREGGSSGGFGQGGFSRGFSRSESSSRGEDSGSGRFGRDRNRGTDSRTGKPVVKMPQFDPITTDLPESFADGDIDKDGQIGMYEWRVWKDKSSSSMAEFMAMDLNRDGFLTPRELVIVGKVGLSSLMPQTAGNFSQSTGGSTQASTPPSTTESTSAQGTGESESSGPTAADSSSEDERARSIASRYFSILDRNKNDSIDPEEWSRSRRLKPKFEEAGVDLNQAISKDTFIQTYLKTQ